MTRKRVAIEVRGPARLLDARGNRVRDRKFLRDLHGLQLVSETMDQYLSGDLFDAGVRNGALTLVERNGVLHWRVEFVAPASLSRRRRQNVIAETFNQISDGMGEGGVDVLIFRRRMHVALDVAARNRRMPVRVRRIPGDAAEARQGPSLFPASRSGNVQRVLTLLKSGAALEEIGRFAQTPIFVAILEQQWPVVRLLVEHGANLGHRMSSGTTPLSHALMASAPQGIVKLFIERGADVNTQDDQGVSALMWAANRGQVRSVKRLLAAGAKTNLLDDCGRNAIFMAEGTGRRNVEALLRLLLAAGVDPHSRSEDGRDALEEAIYQAEGLERMRDKTAGRDQRLKAEFLERAMRV